MNVQRARVTAKTAPLHSDFGKQMLVRRFGVATAVQILETVPLYTRGPRKGLRKGYIAWDKVEVGGWSHAGGRGHVERPGTRNVRVVADNYPTEHAPSIPEGKRFEAETDAEHEVWVAEMLGHLFGKYTQLRGTVPAKLTRRAGTETGWVQEGAPTTCTYPRCKCIVSTSTSQLEPVCPLGLPR